MKYLICASCKKRSSTMTVEVRPVVMVGEVDAAGVLKTPLQIIAAYRPHDLPDDTVYICPQCGHRQQRPKTVTVSDITGTVITGKAATYTIFSVMRGKQGIYINKTIDVEPGIDVESLLYSI